VPHPIDWFFYERRWQKQQRRWQETGEFPRLVVRTYATDGEYEADGNRMLELGYKITGRNVNTRNIGHGSTSTKIKVTYERAPYWPNDSSQDALRAKPA
jgi:hypothetical protein